MNKKITAFAALLITALAAVAVNDSRPSLKWAKILEETEISKIEMTVMPSSENERYKLFDKSEYKEIVALINSSNGKYEPSPEPIAGGGTILYITASDGTIHTVVNNGNTYLCIDGDSYTASYKYLSSWDKYGLNKGDSAIPFPPPDYLEY